MASETLGQALDETLAPERDEHVAAPRRRWTAWLAVAAVVLIGLNLRAGITSASALFHGLQQLLGYGPLVASLLPTIPVLCFAVAGAATAWLGGRIGLERSIALALGLLVAGLALRGFESVVLLLAGTVVAMSGLAICNVAMPSFIREHFPHRTSALTGTFTITMATGATMAAAVTVPLAAQLDSPTGGLAAWAILAAVALAAFLPLAVTSRPRPLAGGKRHVSPWPLLRTRKGLLATALFAIQALLVYALMSWLPFIMISRGLDAASAGLILAVVQVLSIPAVIVLLAMATRPRLLRPAFVLTASCSLAGYVALLLLPAQLGLISAVLLGLGFGVFPLLMLVISRSGSSAAETTALSTLAQSVGYLFAAAGPFGLGILHDAAGSWTPSLVLMLAGSILQMLLCFWITAPERKAQS